MAYALVALSLVVLSGWTGQISLGHAAFLGIGVFLVSACSTAGCRAAGAARGGGGAARRSAWRSGIPSLRLRGVYLTIVTLAFGAPAERYFFPLRGYKPTPCPGRRSSGSRPPATGASTWWRWPCSAIALLVAANLRRSDVGRALFAIRDSEEAAMALGIRIAPYKVGAFALSAALATVAGVLYAMLFQATPAPAQFGVLQSLFLLALPVVGGLESLAGPVVGGRPPRHRPTGGQRVRRAAVPRHRPAAGLRDAGPQRRPRRFGHPACCGRPGSGGAAAVPRYGSFVPEEAVAEQAGDSGPAPRVRLRVPACRPGPGSASGSGAAR